MKQRNNALKNFIKQNSLLFWDTPEKFKTNISDELLLEQILNYADLNTIKEYFKIIGFENAREIFNNLKGRRKQNIYPEIYTLFSEYFKRYV
jgi:hypothetical protein